MLFKKAMIDHYFVHNYIEKLLCYNLGARDLTKLLAHSTLSIQINFIQATPRTLRLL